MNADNTKSSFFYHFSGHNLPIGSQNTKISLREKLIADTDERLFVRRLKYRNAMLKR